jgi:hypothetical protein
MRLGWEGGGYNATGRLFADLTGADERSVRRQADAIPTAERPLWQALGAFRAGRPIDPAHLPFATAMGPDKIPDPTDDHIRALAAFLAAGG